MAPYNADFITENKLELAVWQLINFVPVKSLALQIKCSFPHVEGGVRGARKPQKPYRNTSKPANRIGFFPEYRNRTYMEAHYTD